MALIKKPETVPAREVISTVGKKCAACGAESTGQPGALGGWPPLKGQDCGNYPYTEVTIQIVSHTDDYERTTYENGTAWDLCPACFKSRLGIVLAHIGPGRKIGGE